MKKIDDLKEKVAALTAKIAVAEKSEKLRAGRAEKIAVAHLRHALGGAAIKILRDPEMDFDVRRILLLHAEEAVTKDPENRARARFEAMKKDAGM